MIISPSPLVAWRAGRCGLVTERQLFLLTPLSKPHERSKLKARDIDKYALCPSSTHSRKGGNLPEIMEEFDGPKPCIFEENNNVGRTREASASHDPVFFNSSSRDFNLRSSDRRSDEKVPDDALSLKNQLFVGPPASHNSTNRRRDEEEAMEWFLSPPKTCTLMDPDNGLKYPSAVDEKSLSTSNPKISSSMDIVDKLLPRDNSNIAEECLRGSRKPGDEDDQEFHDLQLWCFANKKNSDEKMEWFLSPPKTCTLMEPLEGRVPSTPCILGTLMEPLEGRIPSTPCILLGESVFKSRRPGENTLKKELWTRFQAVSIGNVDSVSQTVVAKKGFMDMLEEASF